MKISQCNYLLYKLFFILCTVETDISVNFATFLMEYPFLSSKRTSLYSSFNCSSLFILPFFLPSLPPFLIQFALPELSLYCILLLSIFPISARTVIRIEAIGLISPLGSKECNPKFWIQIDTLASWIFSRLEVYFSRVSIILTGVDILPYS